MGFDFINDEHKVRIALSERALITLHNDMNQFDIAKPSTIINIIITNYCDSSKASVNNYLDNEKAAYEQKFCNINIDNKTRQLMIKQLLDIEKENLMNYIAELQKDKSSSILYSINSANCSYLLNECNEQDIYNNKPGQYLKCIIEEYASLPFIQRERIIKKDIYEIVKKAINENKLMLVKLAQSEDKYISLYVCPYKILPDTFHSQDYFACFTYGLDESPKQKKPSSFSMAKLKNIKLRNVNSFISDKDKKRIESAIEIRSVQFLLTEPTTVRVRLTEEGKKMFKTRLYSRPIKDNMESTETDYVFKCNEYHAFWYFYPFGKEARILEPSSLIQKMKKSYEDAFKSYN